MRAFRFPLQRLLRLRAHEERRARRVYATALGELGLLERQEAVLARDLGECRDQAAGTGAAAALAQALATGLERRRRRLRLQVSRAEAQVEAARTAFRERRQEVRSLERLRDRRWEQWRADAVAAEQAELEESARLQRSVSVRREGGAW